MKINSECGGRLDAAMYFNFRAFFLYIFFWLAHFTHLLIFAYTQKHTTIYSSISFVYVSESAGLTLPHPFFTGL